MHRLIRFARRQYLIHGAGLLCLCTSAAVHAAPAQMPWEATPPPAILEDRLRLDVGIWQSKINTFIRADATATQPGTALDGESDVGLADAASVLDMELTLLPGKRQLFRIHGFSSHRHGDAVLTRTIDFDGNTYAVNSRIKSVLNIDMLGVGYAYRLVKHPKFEWDLGLNVEIASAEVNVQDFVNPREADSGRAPIPMLDTELRWQFWRNFQLNGRYRWLGVNVDNGDKKGSLTDSRYGLSWQFNQHLNVGVYQRHFSLSVDLASGSNPGSLRLNHKGWELGVRASL